ncbi:hypothetical protein TRFO_04365 [Tritrichomonas foetus]|uniref:Uncharacterized protein n=1 Tax=Tritrichomonas foetus TaxID=1144522 RepID=A0A1J4KJH4_9EUKA|nr:hypothetical protein TRFO_04365 [Tritrichomonas foetus]|eukprot:OHT09846.1 hypothetical protein TRFO_04365 [Tritrichomonas foetus]
MAKSGSTVIVSAIVMIAIVAIIAFIFLLFVFLMTQFRRVSLNKSIQKLLESEKNDKLQVTEKHLGKMYPLIKDTWDRRADIHPIPELKRLQKGWIRIEDDKVVCIREEIIKSPKAIEQAAISVHSELSRKPTQTMLQYLRFLVNQNVGKLTMHKCNRYLSFYSAARFGSSNLVYTNEDYAIFTGELNKILQAISDGE